MKNDINEISKILLKEESNELQVVQDNNPKIKSLKSIYNYLLNCYSDIFSYYDKPNYNELSYYQMRSSIQEVLDKINS